MKKFFLFPLLAASVFSVQAKITATSQQNVIKCQPFKISQVHLLPSRFQENMKRDSAWMMSIPVGSLLQSFRNTSGAFSSREGGYMTVKKLGGMGIARLRSPWSYHGSSAFSLCNPLCPDGFCCSKGKGG